MIFSLTFTDILFGLTAISVVLFSLFAVLLRNPVRATFFLVTSFLPTGFIYILLHAPLVSLLQIIVYAGAILILFTFVIMMVNPGPGSQESRDGESWEDLKSDQPHRIIIRIFVYTIPLFVLGFLVTQAVYDSVVSLNIASPSQAQPQFGSLSSIGHMIFSNPSENPFVLSFELLSLLVLAGMIAALNLTRRSISSDKKSPSENENKESAL